VDFTREISHKYMIYLYFSIFINFLAMIELGHPVDGLVMGPRAQRAEEVPLLPASAPRIVAFSAAVAGAGWHCHSIRKSVSRMSSLLAS
jgi:hypothetical protein